MIPICLVTGFLGCGKTTFLKRVAAANAHRRIVYLVNEFSPHDVDGALIQSETADVVSIPGGSIFCKCLVTEFIGQLRAIPERWPDVEGVVIEASGMANPKVIGTMLVDTKLDKAYSLSHVISIVDPGSFMKLRHTLPNILAQVEAAGTLLINKSDLYDNSFLDEAEATIRELNAAAKILRCSQAAVDVTLFTADGGHGELTGEYAACRDPNYDTVTVEFESPVSADALRQGLEAISGDLYRAKGTTPTTEGVVFVDYTSAGLNIAPHAESGPHRLVMIARGGTTALESFVTDLGGTVLSA